MVKLNKITKREALISLIKPHWEGTATDLHEMSKERLNKIYNMVYNRSFLAIMCGGEVKKIREDEV